jgi:hypothetical protein
MPLESFLPIGRGGVPASGFTPLPDPSNPNLFQRTLTGISSALEPLAYLQQLAFTTTVGVRTGDFSRLGKTIQETAAYAPFGARPDMLSGESLLREAFGVKDDNQAKWGGLALDFLADPLLAGGYLRGAARLAQAGGAADVATGLRAVASRADYLTGLQAPAKGLGRAIEGVDTLLGQPLAKGAAAASGRVFSNLLQRDVTIEAAQGLGRVAEEMLFQTLDLPTPFKRPNFTTRVGEADTVRQLTVGEVVASGSASARRVFPWLDTLSAQGRNERIRVAEEFRRGIGEMDSLVAAIDPQRGAGYNQFMTAIGEHLDDLGGIGVKEGTDFLAALQGAKRTVDVVPVASVALKTAKKRTAFMERIATTARTLGLDVDVAQRNAEQALAVSYATIMRAGFNASQYEDGRKAIVAAGGRIGLKPEESMSLAIRRYGLGEDGPSWRDTRGEGMLFHGTSSPIKALDDDLYTTLNYYGQGFYTTEAFDIAKGYSKKGRGPLPTIYNVEATKPVKLFDMETPVDANIKAHLQKFSGFGADQIALDLLSENPNLNLRQLYDGVRQESKAEGLTADDVQEFFAGISDHLMQRGFEGMAHVGGNLTGKAPHRVNIYFTPKASGIAISPLAKEDTEGRADFLAVINEEFSKIPSFTAGLDARTWLKGMFGGYARKVMGVYQDPQRLTSLLERGDVKPFRQINPESFRAAFKDALQANPDADKIANAVASFAANGTRVVYAKDILDVAARNGAELTLDQTKDILSRVDPDFQINQQTFEILSGIGRNQQLGIQRRAFGLNSNAFQRRTLEDTAAENLTQQLGRPPTADEIAQATDEYQAALVELTDAPTRLASLGVEIGKTIGAQSVLKTAFTELQGMGMVKDFGPNAPVAKVVDGVEYSLVPEGADFGALAGKHIPSMVWRDIAQTAAGPQAQGEWTKWVGRIRAAFLSPLPSTFRNAIGNVALMSTVGVHPDAIAKHLPKAYEILKTYAKDGYHPELDGVEGVANFMHDAGMVKELQDLTQDGLLRLIQEASKSKKPFPVALRDLVANPDRVPFLQRLGDAADAVGEATVGQVRRIGASAPDAFGRPQPSVGDKAADFFLGEGLGTPTRSVAAGGFLHWFQAVEDVGRLVSYLSAKEARIAAGDAPQAAKLAAAKFANTATFDYSNAPKVVEWARNTGAVLFPSFAYYMTGRVLKGMWSNPAPLAVQDKIVSAANEAGLSGENEEAAIEKMLTGYWGMKNRPVLVPIAGKNGEYLSIPTNYFMPSAVFNPQTLNDMASGAAAGGVLRPLVDLTYAWFATGGQRGQTTPFTAPFRGGDPIFSPDATTAQAVVGSLSYLAQSYAPGTVIRTALPQVEKLADVQFDPKQAALMEQLQQRYLNLQPGQLAGRLVGVNTYAVGQQTALRQISTNDRRSRDEVAAIRREYEAKIALATQTNPLEAQRLNNEYALRVAEITSRYGERSQTVASGLDALVQQAAASSAPGR